MPSSCPKCRRVVEEDEICCAQVRYTWRCKSCFKLTSGFAVPYGKCFLCGGELELIQNRDLRRLQPPVRAIGRLRSLDGAQCLIELARRRLRLSVGGKHFPIGRMEDRHLLHDGKGLVVASGHAQQVRIIQTGLTILRVLLVSLADAGRRAAQLTGVHFGHRLRQLGNRAGRQVVTARAARKRHGHKRSGGQEQQFSAGRFCMRGAEHEYPQTSPAADVRKNHAAILTPAIIC